MPSPKWFAGLDLGLMADFSTLALLEHVGPGDARRPDQTFHCRLLIRWPLRTDYPTVVAAVGAMLGAHPIDGAAVLAYDQTGVGTAVGNLLTEAARSPQPVADDRGRRPLYTPPPALRVASLHGVTITGGNEVHRRGDDYAVPKVDLIGGLQVALQTRRLRIAPDLEHAATLVTELRDYRLRVSLAGHISYGTADEWRTSPHDDLILGLAIAWWAAQGIPSSVVTVRSWLPAVDDEPRRPRTYWQGEQR
jgi:hypothetical protein